MRKAILILLLSTVLVAGSFAATLKVVSPNGGEILNTGSWFDIKWTSNSVKNPIKISLWQNNRSVGVIASGINPAQSKYRWKVASMLSGKVTPGKGFQIKIKEKGSAVSDMSDRDFSISGAQSLTVIAPMGGRFRREKEQIPIEFAASGLSGTVKIELVPKHNTTISPVVIKSAYPVNGGRFMYPIPLKTKTGFYFIKFSHSSGLSVLSHSLLIDPGGVITIISPKGGEILKRGQDSLYVEFKSDFIKGTVEIALHCGSVSPPIQSFIKMSVPAKYPGFKFKIPSSMRPGSYHVYIYPTQRYEALVASSKNFNIVKGDNEITMIRPDITQPKVYHLKESLKLDPKYLQPKVKGPTLLTKPDLIVTEVLTTPAMLKAGAGFQVTVRVKNIGGDMGPIYFRTGLSVRHSTVRGPNTFTSPPLKGLAYGKETQVRFNVAAYNHGGKLELKATADNTGIVDESNENNNQKTLGIKIQ